MLFLTFGRPDDRPTKASVDFAEIPVDQTVDQKGETKTYIMCSGGRVVDRLAHTENPVNFFDRPAGQSILGYREFCILSLSVDRVIDRANPKIKKF